MTWQRTSRPKSWTTRTRPGTIGRTMWTSTSVRRQWPLKGVMSPCENGTYTSPSAAHVLVVSQGWLPGRRQGFSETWTGSAHLFSVLHPSPKEAKGDLGTSHPEILNHGLTNDKFFLEKYIFWTPKILKCYCVIDFTKLFSFSSVTYKNKNTLFKNYVGEPRWPHR